MRFIDNDGFNTCKMWYAPITATIVNEETTFTQSELHEMAEDYAILCPCISQNHALNRYFTIICKSWR